MRHRLTLKAFHETLYQARNNEDQTLLQELAEQSYSDYRVKGMDSVCLYKDNETTIRVISVESNKCNSQGFLMHPRSLNFTTSTIVLSGHVGLLRFIKNGWANNTPFGETLYDPQTNEIAGYKRPQFITYAHEEIYATNQCFHVTHNETTALKTDYVFNSDKVILGFIERRTEQDKGTNSKIYLPYVPFKKEIEEFTETKGEPMSVAEYKMTLKIMIATINNEY